MSIPRSESPSATKTIEQAARREVYGRLRELIQTRTLGMANVSLGDLLCMELERVIVLVEKSFGDRVDD